MYICVHILYIIYISRLAFEKRVISCVHRDAISSILLIVSRANSEERRKEKESD